jgi:hypothetical protein
MTIRGNGFPSGDFLMAFHRWYSYCFVFGDFFKEYDNLKIVEVEYFYYSNQNFDLLDQFINLILL